MNLLISLVQLFFEHQTVKRTEQLRSMTDRVSEVGQSIGLIAILSLMSFLFIVFGFLILSIEFGLQIESGNFFKFSGLVISSLILWSLALLLTFVSSLILKKSKSESVEDQPASPKKNPNDDVLDLVYDIVLMYLREFKENHEKSRKSNG